ncbi:hypothetical protein MASR2M15_25580 [Anaerolineales bacterium]
MELSLIIVLLVGLLGGAAVGLQSPLAASIATRLGPLESVFIVHMSGALLSFLILLVQRGGRLAQAVTLPWYMLLSGGFGIIVIMAVSFAIPRVGALGATLLILAGQIIISLAFDHFGWLELEIRPFNLQALLGLSLVLIGTLLVLKR